MGRGGNPALAFFPLSRLQLKKENGLVWAEAQVFQPHMLRPKDRPAEDIGKGNLATLIGLPETGFGERENSCLRLRDNDFAGSDTIPAVSLLAPGKKA